MPSNTVTKGIRNKGGLFLKQDGTWTVQFEEAEKFNDLNSVFAAKLQFHIENADLVLVMDDHNPPSKYDVILPL